MSPLDVLLWALAAVAFLSFVAICITIAIAIRFLKTGRKVAELIADDQEWSRMQRRGPEDRS